MEQTAEDQKILHTEETTSGDAKADSLKMVEVVNLLQSNLVRTTRLMWGQLFVIGGFIIFLFIAYFSLLSKTPSIGNVAALPPQSLAKPSPASEIISAPQAAQTEPSAKSSDAPDRKEVQVVLDQVRKAQLTKDVNLFLQVYSPTFPDLAEKKKSLLESWRKYNYLDMKFHIENIQRKNAHTLFAEVACGITVEDIQSQKKDYLMKNYIINFSESSGKKLIQGITQEKKNNNGESSGPNNKML